jgi:hypothetical protein
VTLHNGTQGEIKSCTCNNIHESQKQQVELKILAQAVSSLYDSVYIKYKQVYDDRNQRFLYEWGRRKKGEALRNVLE